MYPPPSPKKAEADGTLLSYLPSIGRRKCCSGRATPTKYQTHTRTLTALPSCELNNDPSCLAKKKEKVQKYPMDLKGNSQNNH